MTWARKETHSAGGYAFHWFSDGERWFAAVWSADAAPNDPSFEDIETALTILRSPVGGEEQLRVLCMRFVEDVPYRIRAIRGKIPSLRRLGA